MKLKKNKLFLGTYLLVFILALIVTVGNANVLADDISFEKAVEIALENNDQIKNLENNIESLKRSNAMIKAQQDWQININANYNHIFEDENSNSSLNSMGNEDNINLEISKNFKTGFSFNPSITISENDENLTIDINQILYPITETQLNKNLFKNNKELIKAEINLEKTKADKIISWLESYLNIIRLEERKLIYENNLKKAEKNYNKVKEEREIGEAGKQQILTAELSLENARYNLKEIKNNISLSKKNFKVELGFEESKDINFNINSPYITDLSNKVDSIVKDYLQKDNLMKMVEKNNIDLIANKIDRDLLNQEMEWLKKEDDANINLSGSYNTESEDLRASLHISYDIYDGGKENLDIKSKEAKLEQNRDNYKSLYRKLEIELQSHLNKLSLNKDNVKKMELSYERSKFEAEVARKQFDRGLIDYLEYQEKWINSKEAEISLKSSKDNVLLNKLRFINFINSEKITGGFDVDKK